MKKESPKNDKAKPDKSQKKSVKSSASKNKKINVTMLQKRAKIRRGGANAKTSETRAKFLHAFEETHGNITASSLYAGISRLTFYRWMKSKSRVNLRFQEKIKLLKPIEAQLDLAEAVVNTHLKNYSLRAAELVLKTRGQRRGYAEKSIDLEYELVLRAVTRIENIINQQIARDANFKPDLKRFSELAAADFGVKSEAVEKEFLKRQPQIFEQIG